MPQNVPAWETYWRVHDQIDVWPTKEKDKQHVALRTQAIAAAVSLLSPDDPPALYDQVMLIHQTRYRQRL